MNEDFSKKFHHLTLTPEQLAHLLNLKGKITRWWLESEADYFHFVIQMDDDSKTGFMVFPGQYVEQSNIAVEVQELRDLHDYPVTLETYKLHGEVLFSRTVDRGNDES